MQAALQSNRSLPARSAALVIGEDSAFRRALVQELAGLPMPVTMAESLRLGAQAADCRDRSAPRVVLLPESEVRVDEFEQALAELRVRAGSPRLVPIVFGRAPSPERREALRQAGAELALFGRFGRHALRFQVNRALAPAAQRSLRGERRAPMEWRTRVFVSGREKLVRCYTLSSAGGYFVTPRPFVVGSAIDLELPSSATAALRDPRPHRLHQRLGQRSREESAARHGRRLRAPRVGPRERDPARRPGEPIRTRGLSR